MKLLAARVSRTKSSGRAWKLSISFPLLWVLSIASFDERDTDWQSAIELLYFCVEETLDDWVHQCRELTDSLLPFSLPLHLRRMNTFHFSSRNHPPTKVINSEIREAQKIPERRLKDCLPEESDLRIEPLINLPSAGSKCCFGAENFIALRATEPLNWEFE